MEAQNKTQVKAGEDLSRYSGPSSVAQTGLSRNDFPGPCPDGFFS